MKCKKCDHEMELEEYFFSYEDDVTVEVEEHWWCPDCDATPTRFVTYEIKKERWED